jgi:hypothetical protein
MRVQMENHLACGLAVVLSYGYSGWRENFSLHVGYPFHDLVNVSLKIVRDFMNVLIVLLGHDECVASPDRFYVEKG